MTGGDTPVLTVRERQVLVLIADGCTNPEIAARLGVTLGTVKKHVRAIFIKFNAAGREHAVAIAMRAGVLS